MKGSTCLVVQLMTDSFAQIETRVTTPTDNQKETTSEDTIELSNELRRCRRNGYLLFKQ